MTPPPTLCSPGGGGWHSDPITHPLLPGGRRSDPTAHPLLPGGRRGPPDREDAHGLGPLHPLPRGRLWLQNPGSGGRAAAVLAVVQEGRRLRGYAQALQGRVHVVHQCLQVQVVLCAWRARDKRQQQ